MATRFRYTTAEGVEIGVRDLDELRDHVASGRVLDDTPFYDDSTGRLAPAGEHQAYADAKAAAAEERSNESRDSGLPDLGVTLAEAPEELPNTDDVVRELLEERERDADVGGTLNDLGSAEVDQYNPTLRSWAPDGPEERTPEGEVANGPAGRTDGDGGTDGARPTSPSPLAGPAPAPGVDPWQWEPVWTGPPSAASAEKSRGAAWSRLRLLRRAASDRPKTAYTVALTVTLVLAAGYLTVGLEAGAPDPEESPVVVESTAPLDPVGVADRLAASEGIAFGHMVRGMDSLGRAHDVYEVPTIWLDGAYFADAAGHPEVREYWRRYGDFVEVLRREDEALFRQSFLARLRSLDVGASVISLRLAQAVRRFEATQPQRDGLYARMTDLAGASLSLHDLLVRRGDDISYDPPGGSNVAADPFLQIRTDDEELQETLWSLLDRIFEDIDALHGENRWSRDRMTEGVLESIRATGEDAGLDF